MSFVTRFLIAIINIEWQCTLALVHVCFPTTHVSSLGVCVVYTITFATLVHATPLALAPGHISIWRETVSGPK